MVVSVGKKRFRVSSAKTSKAARACLAMMLALSITLQPLLVNAQIAADPNAGAGYRPDIGAAANGVPLVDITTPNGRGLSHNRYSDFNVGRPGAILNNHDREIGNSQLGGVVPGNPHLRYSGSASVILNEVTSSNRSALQGPVEVFGRRADVVIANPNGITCNGCGFINTPRATLATGIPEIGIDGMLRGFHVSGGDVTFGPDGANLLSGKGTVDIFDIVSRYIRLDGPVAGHDVGLIAGTGRFDYASREMKELVGIAGTPEYAIDGSALGALQAGRIRVIVTEKGAGVRMRSDMAANAGQLTLSADGRISLNNVSGRDGVSVKSGSRAVTARKITSRKAIALKAAKGIDLQAAAADADIVADAGRGLLSVAGDMQARGHISLNTSDRITGNQFVSGGDLEIYAGNGIELLAAVADRQAMLKTAYGDIIAKNGIKAGGGDLFVTAGTGNITAETLISYHDAVIHAGRDIDITGNILAAGNIAVEAGVIRAASTVSGIDFAAGTAGLVLSKAGETQLFARVGDVAVGQVASGGNTRITARNDISYDSVNSFGALDLVSDYGSISFYHSTSAAGNISLKAQMLDLSNNRARISTGRTLGLHGQTINLSNSQLVYGGLVIDGRKIVEVYNSSLNAITKNGGSGNISITAPAFSADRATNLIAENDLNIASDAITNSGQMAAGHDLRLISKDYLHNNRTGLIFAGNNGWILANGDIINDYGAIKTGGNLAFANAAGNGKSRSLQNRAGLVQAGADLTVRTGYLKNEANAVPVITERSEEARSGFIQPEGFKPEGAGDGWRGLLVNRTVGGNEWGEGNSYKYHDYWFKRLWRDREDASGTLVMPDGTVFKAFTWIYVDTREDGTINLYRWNYDAAMSQKTVTQYFTEKPSIQGMIQSGGNMMIDAGKIDNFYSNIEAGGNADIVSGSITNLGIALYKNVYTGCENGRRGGACFSYNADGSRNAAGDIANGSVVHTGSEVVDSLSSVIKAGGTLNIKADELNNTAAPGSIAGNARYVPEGSSGNPMDALDGLTAGSALFRPNVDMDFDRKVPKFDSGGFGGTLPGQYFIYETRADFIDIGKFYGSGYYLNRIGYSPDRQMLFLGDAYFENQLIEKQIRDLVGTGLGKGSFIPGNSPVEQVKSLLDNGMEFARENGLEFGQPLTAEQVAKLDKSIVVYVRQNLNGTEVYAPVVYLAAGDRGSVAASGARIEGGNVRISVDTIASSGLIRSSSDLNIDATTILANGGGFAADGNIMLAAAGDIRLNAATTRVDGKEVVVPSSSVSAGQNAVLGAKGELSLKGASISAGESVGLSAGNIHIGTARADSGKGSQNATGSRITAGKDVAVAAKNDITVSGSSIHAGDRLSMSAESGNLSIRSEGVERSSRGSASTSQQKSELSSGGSTALSAGQNLVIAGSDVTSGESLSLKAGKDIAIVSTENRESFAGGGGYRANTVTQQGSTVTAGQDIAAGAGQNIMVGGSDM